MPRLARAAALGALLVAPLGAASAAASGATSGGSPPTAAATPPPSPPISPPPQLLDLAALATASKTIEIGDEPLRAALIKGKPDGVVFSTALDLGDGAAAIAWSECSKAGCRGSVATLTGIPSQPKLARKAALAAPPRVHFADGFAFEPPALADLDGDGAPEIVLHYRTTEPPRAALGSMSREYVVAYAPKDLSLVFSHELRRAGAESENACQWTLGRSGDRLTASGQCNTRSCLEASPPAAGCKPNKTFLETWRKTGTQKSYVRIANPNRG